MEWQFFPMELNAFLVKIYLKEKKKKDLYGLGFTLNPKNPKPQT